jgi:TetR/AcrR family transcriptional repressor of nem operon
VARPREFDIDAVLDCATRLFWQRGYGGTSLADIEAATGLSRTSIYAAFGDKEGLFVSVVGYYDMHYAAQLRAALCRAATARAGIDAYFERLLAAFADPDLPLGCLVTNVAVEGDRGATRLGRRIAASIALTEDAFHALLRRGQLAGEVAPLADARAVARQFVAVTHGLSVLAKASAQPSVLHDVVRTTLAAMRPLLFRDPPETALAGAAAG